LTVIEGNDQVLHPRVVHSDQVFRIAYWHNAAIVDVGGDMDVLHMKRLGRAYRDLLKDHPEGIVSCSVMRPDVPISSADARDESARVLKELGDSLLRVAMVPEHQGVVAQVISTVIRGINIVARNPKLVLFRTLEDATKSLAPLVKRQAPVADTAVELLAAVNAVRQDYDPRGAGSATQAVR